MPIHTLEQTKSLSSGEGKFTILLAEPYPIVAYAFEKLLQPFPRLALVSTVGTGLKVLSSYRKYKPNLVILDAELPGIGLVDLVNQLRRRNPLVKILVYLTLRECHLLNPMFKLKIQGVVLKNQPNRHLLDALSHIMQGKVYVDPALDPAEINKSNESPELLGLPHLSPRERQVLKLIAEGLKNREISHNFAISIKTVESHRLNLMRKLDAHHVVDLVHWARRYQLLAL